ncbi:MAG: phosphopentomutase [Clostridiales bacterium]|nr:phosphopentomutase [Clostridiales bacterium]
MAKRVFIIILDSLGAGSAPDAGKFGDEGSNTLAAVLSGCKRPLPNLAKMGLLDLDINKDPRIAEYITRCGRDKLPAPLGTYGSLREESEGGKDSTIGHWEIAGVVSAEPQPTYPNGFPEHITEKLKQISGRGILCNLPYSGTQAIADFGDEHMTTGDLILYTSADSVLQIAAHEEVVPLDELYRICKEMRSYMTGKDAVGRIIARPFIGTSGNFTRTSNRHDFAVEAPSSTMMDHLKLEGFDVISIGKIFDLFAGRGFTEKNPTKGNTDGISKIKEYLKKDFKGLCFANLVDFDMLYGHRNNIEGYAEALAEFDDALGEILENLREEDLLIITADHGCDPSTESTDHSREQVPVLIYGDGHKVPCNIGSILGFGYISEVVINALEGPVFGKRFEERDLNPKDSSDVMTYVDLTNLKVVGTEDDIKALIDKAIANRCMSVCIQPCYVRFASEYAAGRIPVCTVIGFPNGYNTTATKIFEAREAADNGASEIDMVVNVAFVKSGRMAEVSEEIKLIADAVHEKGAILKVIIETCYLTEEEKIALCKAVEDSGAEYIKTSTGFGTQGATVEDVKLMRANLPDNVRIKAAGGIRTEDAARQMIDAGATRIGASGIS